MEEKQPVFLPKLNFPMKIKVQNFKISNFIIFRRLPVMVFNNF